MTQEFLMSILHYNPNDGVWTWLPRPNLAQRWNTRCAGKRTGYPTGNGYIVLTINNRKYLAHRLAFLYMTGAIPKCVDHIDRNPANCRWDNLRPATRSDNMGNIPRSSSNKSGFKGVHWEQGKWCARIRRQNKKYFLGYFEDPSQAHAAYVKAAEKLFVDFANAG